MALDKKKLTIFLSTLSTVLTISILLLQLYSLLLIKLLNQRRELETMRIEALTARNTAMTRYRRTRLR